MSKETQPAMAYPTQAQYERWKAQAEADGYDSVSRFMQDMIEAGMKKFDATVEPDETTHELREQRNDLKTELDTARDRIRRLEDRLHHGERETVRQYVEEHPGATFDEIVQHVIDTVPARVTQHLDTLEGDELRVEEDAYYPADDSGVADR